MSMTQKQTRVGNGKPKTTPTPTSEKVKNKTVKEIICSVIKKKTRQKFLTTNQKKYYDSLIENEISICSGPAGVGKSYITMKAAIDLISDPGTPYEKIGWKVNQPLINGMEKTFQWINKLVNK